MSTSAKKTGGWRTNKWIRAAIPALLLHCSIGTVYCWSIFSQEIANYIGFSKGAIEWAFSFAIFFLGMSAAFLGNIVEKDIHKSSLIATICFAVGMAGTGAFIWFGGNNPGSPIALIGIYLCYGLIMGIGLGTGYLSPVKTLMLWFSDRKGLATGLAVAGFGAAKAIASPIIRTMVSAKMIFLKTDFSITFSLSRFSPSAYWFCFYYYQQNKKCGYRSNRTKNANSDSRQTNPYVT